MNEDAKGIKPSAVVAMPPVTARIRRRGSDQRPGSLGDGDGLTK